MVTKLGMSFAEDCVQLDKRISQWTSDAKKNLKRVHRIVGQRWRAEAVKRVPVEFGTLKERILSNAYEDGQYIFVTEVGTNVVEYPVYLEFGTRFIAKGQVLAIGDSTDITDQQAVHTWPAKEYEAIAKTSHSINSAGELRNDPSRFVSQIVAGPQEQMPWLRPAFNSIRIWVIAQLNTTIEPPP